MLHLVSLVGVGGAVPHADVRHRRGRAGPRPAPAPRPPGPWPPGHLARRRLRLAHEALVRAWPRLRGWLDEDRAGQQIRRHLTIAAAGWEALDRPDTELYSGARLAAVLDWLERGDEPLTQIERAFVQASRSIADEEVRRLLSEARRQQVLNRRLRTWSPSRCRCSSSARSRGWSRSTVVARPGARRDAAEKAAVAEAHRSLVARSLGLRATNLDVAAMLAVAAWRESPDALAESALLGAVTAEPGFLGYRWADLSDGPAAAAVPGTGQVLVANGTAVQLLDPESADLSPAFGRDLTGSCRQRASRERRRIARRAAADVAERTELPSGCHLLVVDDLLTRRAITMAVPVPFAATDVAISDDGSLVAAVGIGGSRWDTATWERDGPASGPCTGRWGVRRVRTRRPPVRRDPRSDPRAGTPDPAAPPLVAGASGIRRRGTGRGRGRPGGRGQERPGGLRPRAPAAPVDVPGRLHGGRRVRTTAAGLLRDQRGAGRGARPG